MEWYFVYRNVCTEIWASPRQSEQYTCALLTLQFALPLAALICTYARIAYVVWGVRPPGEAETNRDSRMQLSKRKVFDYFLSNFSPPDFKIKNKYWNVDIRLRNLSPLYFSIYYVLSTDDQDDGSCRHRFYDMLAAVKRISGKHSLTYTTKIMKETVCNKVLINANKQPNINQQYVSFVDI